MGFVAYLYIMSFGWSALRLGELTLFDTATIILFPVLFIASYRRTVEIFRSTFVFFMFASAFFMTLGTLLSSVFAHDPDATVTRGLLIATTLTITALNINIIVKSRILTVPAIARSMLFSATIHSIVGIAQGQFGQFQWLNAKVDNWEAWTRATGLTEHPIEAGMVAGTGVVVGVLLFFSKKSSKMSYAFYALCVAVCAWSMLYSASLTAALGVSFAVFVQFCVSRRYFAIASVGALLAIVMAVSFTSMQESQLGTRLDALINQGSSYNTVEIRDNQINEVLASFTAASVLVGRGYDANNLPGGHEIHDGAIAALYHFGILGFISQLVVIAFVASCAISRRSTQTGSVLSALLIIFLAGYLTGPGLSRRSAWFPVLAFAAISAAEKKSSRKFQARREGQGGYLVSSI